ncbi:hypothetical protein GCM10008949_31530 [Deinococcus humi]|nr:hypothetical protein GCM10008949_31530 [Deinococcus humi]
MMRRVRAAVAAHITASPATRTGYSAATPGPNRGVKLPGSHSSSVPKNPRAKAKVRRKARPGLGRGPEQPGQGKWREPAQR